MADIEIASEPTLITDLAQERGKRGTFQTTFVFGGLKRHLNPNEAAALDLKTALDRFPFPGDSIKRDYSNRVVGMPQLIHMNKVVMAACFYMIYISNGDVNPTNFNRLFQDIYPFLDQGSDKDKRPENVIERAYKEECIRYLSAILGYVDFPEFDNK